MKVLPQIFLRHLLAAHPYWRVNERQAGAVIGALTRARRDCPEQAPTLLRLAQQVSEAYIGDEEIAPCHA